MHAPITSQRSAHSETGETVAPTPSGGIETPSPSPGPSPGPSPPPTAAATEADGELNSRPTVAANSFGHWGVTRVMTSICCSSSSADTQALATPPT